MDGRQQLSGRLAEEKNILSLPKLERRIAQSKAQSGYLLRYPGSL